MMIRFGRRRLVLMFTDDASSAVEANPLPGADDRELIAWSRSGHIDPEIARAAGLGLMYGGHNISRKAR